MSRLRNFLIIFLFLIFFQSCSSLKVCLYEKRGSKSLLRKSNTLVVFYIYHNYPEPLKFIVEYSMDKKEGNFRILEEMSKEIPSKKETINYFICKVKNKKDFYLRLSKFLGDGFQGELPTMFQKIKYGEINYLGTFRITFDMNSYEYIVVRKEDKEKLSEVLLKIAQDFQDTKFEKIALTKLRTMRK